MSLPHLAGGGELFVLFFVCGRVFPWHPLVVTSSPVLSLPSVGEGARFDLLMSRVLEAVEVLCGVHPDTTLVSIRASDACIQEIVRSYRRDSWGFAEFPVEYGFRSAIGLLPNEFLVQSDVLVEWAPGDWRPASVEVYDLPVPDPLYRRFVLGAVDSLDAVGVFASVLGWELSSPQVETAYQLVRDGSPLYRAFVLSEELCS